mmetsp:Transcript_844/g.1627  ORF Transcript_844/g.1627 Transcript_844/m.1627 type:complete len:396 (-) Transcript_844:150-1337(-)
MRRRRGGGFKKFTRSPKKITKTVFRNNKASSLFSFFHSFIDRTKRSKMTTTKMANAKATLEEETVAVGSMNKVPEVDFAAAPNEGVVEEAMMMNEPENKIDNAIASVHCSSPGCPKHGQKYIHVGTGVKIGPYCDACQKKELNGLSDAELHLHREFVEIYNHVERPGRASAAALKKLGGKKVDEIIYGYACDPKMTYFDVSEDGLLTIVAGHFTTLFNLIRANGSTVKDEKGLMGQLRTNFGFIPDASCCYPGRGPDDEGPTVLFNGWKDKDVLLWRPEWDVEDGGNPKFGHSEEFKAKAAKIKKKAKAKKKAAKEAKKQKKSSKKAKKKVSGKENAKQAFFVESSAEESSAEESFDEESSDEEEDDRKPAAKKRKGKDMMARGDDSDSDWELGW